MIENTVGAFGGLILRIAEETGQFTFLVRSTFGWMASYHIEWRQTLIQMVRVGVESQFGDCGANHQHHRQ